MYLLFDVNMMTLFIQLTVRPSRIREGVIDRDEGSDVKLNTPEPVTNEANALRVEISESKEETPLPQELDENFSVESIASMKTVSYLVF